MDHRTAFFFVALNLYALIMYVSLFIVLLFDVLFSFHSQGGNKLPLKIESRSTFWFDN